MLRPPNSHRNSYAETAAAQDEPEQPAWGLSADLLPVARPSSLQADLQNGLMTSTNALTARGLTRKSLGAKTHILWRPFWRSHLCASIPTSSLYEFPFKFLSRSETTPAISTSVPELMRIDSETLQPRTLRLEPWR